MKILLLLSLLTGFNSFGADDRFEDHAVLSIEKHLDDTLKSFDSRSFSVVDFEKTSIQEKLPGTPFVYENLVVHGEEIIADRILKVSIYISKQETETQTRDFIQVMLKGLGFKQAEVKYMILPPVPQVAAVPEKISAVQEFGEMIAPFIQKWFWIELGGLGTLALLFLILIYRTKKIEVSVGDGLNKVSSSMQNVSETRPEVRATQEVVFDQGSPTESRSLLEFSDSALRACFTDCYWVMNDKYAAYLWKKMNVNQKQSLLIQCPFLGEYVTWLGSVAAEDQGLLSDLYYLDPKNLDRVDQTRLLNLVSKNKEWFFVISKMRADHLPISLDEKLEIFKRRTELMDLAKHLPVEGEATGLFTPRQLPSMFKIHLKTIEEEQNFLAIPDLSQEMLLAVQSLGILLHISEARAESILNRYTAKELMSGWIAPEDVLLRLEKLVSPKKLEIMQSYRGKVTPSRESRVFKEMLALGHDVLRSGKEDEGELAIGRAA